MILPEADADARVREPPTWLAAGHFGRVGPTQLSWVATSQHVSASTQNQALSALLFLYRHVLHIDLGPIEPAARGKMPHRIPVVLSVAEVSQVLSHVPGVMWLVVALLYGAG